MVDRLVLQSALDVIADKSPDGSVPRSRISVVETASRGPRFTHFPAAFKTSADRLYLDNARRVVTAASLPTIVNSLQ